MAVIFGLAVLYHAAVLSIPAFAKAAYPASYPPLRHVAFVIVNSLATFLFLTQPRWFIWPYLVLTVQVLQGHGVRLWRTWVDDHLINWIDVSVISGVLLGLALLLQERTGKGNNGSAGYDPGRRAVILGACDRQSVWAQNVQTARHTRVCPEVLGITMEPEA